LAYKFIKPKSWQAKIMASQHHGLPKSGHTKVRAESLGIHMV